MKWSLPPKIALGFGAALVTVVVGGATSYRALAVRQENVRDVTRALTAIGALEKLLGVLRDAEIGQRGYLLTSNESYLEPYQSAMEIEKATLDDLRAVLRGDPQQPRRLAELEPLISRKLEDLQRTVELARAGRREAALEVVRTGQGIARMGDIRDQISQMETVERLRLEDRQHAWTRSIFISNIIFGVSNLALLVVIALAANQVRKELRGREAREAERSRLIEMQQYLMGIVGHDLRNPLAAIMASGELLTRATDIPTGRARSVRRIMQSGRRMDRMIRDLLDFARARVEGGIPLRPRRADLSQICRRIVDELVADSPDRKIECAHHGQSTGEWDPDRLEQVISNLLSNALRYGSQEAPVELITTGSEDEVSIEVHNDGSPIPPDLLPNIFEPFRRGADSGRGVGLGLFIVRTLVEAHGGGVTVRSRDGEGTTFRVDLPRWQRKPEPKPPAAGEAALAAVASAPESGAHP